VGFQGDRIFLQQQHMSNGPLHVLIQSGLLGFIPWAAALVLAWVLVFRLLHGSVTGDSLPLPPDIPGILAFLTISTTAESTFAFYSSDWMIGAPLLGYVQYVAWQRRAMAARARAARQMHPRFVPPEAIARR